MDYNPKDTISRATNNVNEIRRSVEEEYGLTPTHHDGPIMAFIMGMAMLMEGVLSLFGLSERKYKTDIRDTHISKLQRRKRRTLEEYARDSRRYDARVLREDGEALWGKLLSPRNSRLYSMPRRKTIKKNKPKR